MSHRHPGRPAGIATPYDTADRGSRADRDHADRRGVAGLIAAYQRTRAEQHAGPAVGGAR